MIHLRNLNPNMDRNLKQQAKITYCKLKRDTFALLMMIKLDVVLNRLTYFYWKYMKECVLLIK